MIKCKGCNKKPLEVASIVYEATSKGVSPDLYVKTNYKTYDQRTEEFTCNTCYFKTNKTVKRGIIL